MSAIESLLNAPDDHAAQQLLGEGRGRGLAEQRGPAQPQVILVEGPQLFDLSDDFAFCALAHRTARRRSAAFDLRTFLYARLVRIAEIIGARREAPRAGWRRRESYAGRKRAMPSAAGPP